MNTYRRLHGLILPCPELDWNLMAGSSAIGGADCTMSRLNPRRVRSPIQRFAADRQSHRRAVQERHSEARNVNALSTESDVRHELIRRVRQEIQAGVYDTPEKFEAALDRMTNHFDRD